MTDANAGYFDAATAQYHAAARRRWLRERHATAANRHQENLRRGAEMLREHFGGDWPRGERACLAFLMDHLHQEVWAGIGVVALCELFQPDADGKTPPASGLRVVGETGPVLEFTSLAVTVHASAEDFIRAARLSRQALSHLEASPSPDIRSSAVAEMVQALPLTEEGSDRLTIDIGCAEARIAEYIADGALPPDPLSRAIGLRTLLVDRGWPLYFATAIALADGGACPARVFRSLEVPPAATSEPLRNPSA